MRPGRKCRALIFPLFQLYMGCQGIESGLVVERWERDCWDGMGGRSFDSDAEASALRMTTLW
jgi:hypothetical protein